MRRWIRRLGWTAGCMVLVGTTVLCWLSSQRWDHWILWWDGADRYWRMEVESSAGGMALSYDHGSFARGDWPEVQRNLGWGAHHYSDSSTNLGFPLVEGRGPLTWLGLSGYARRGGTGSSWRLSFPLWMPEVAVATCLLTSLRRQLRRLRRDRRRAAGLCTECGYDLRGSGPQCPECGVEREAPATPTPEQLPAPP
jgi:hypothetical protein